jgi:hypothetical protein
MRSLSILVCLATIPLFAKTIPSPATATTTYTFTYSTQLVGSSVDCSTAAQQLGQKFAVATQTNVVQAVCRNEQNLSADGQSYKVYTLGVVYTSTDPSQPYIATLGKRDLLNPVLTSQSSDLYPTLASCLNDIGPQTQDFEAHTGLSAVSSTCVVGETDVGPTEYYLKIEGFDQSRGQQAQPKEYIFTFAPFSYNKLRTLRQMEVANYISTFGAEIVKQGVGVFVYYKANGPVPVSVENLGHFANADDCRSQVDNAHAILTKAGSSKLLIWCDDNFLSVTHDGTYNISTFPHQLQTRYDSLGQCIADMPFVLSDARNADELGAICALNMYDSSFYTMSLYHKGP